MAYVIQFHPATARDILEITHWLIEYSDHEVAARRIDEIRSAAQGLTEFPHRGSIRSEVARGLRVVSAADQNAVMTYLVNDEAREVLIVAISYAGGDWMAKSRSRLER